MNSSNSSPCVKCGHTHIHGDCWTNVECHKCECPGFESTDNQDNHSPQSKSKPNKLLSCFNSGGNQNAKDVINRKDDGEIFIDKLNAKGCGDIKKMTTNNTTSANKGREQ